jgi:hypothetical protein
VRRYQSSFSLIIVIIRPVARAALAAQCVAWRAHALGYDWLDLYETMTTTMRRRRMIIEPIFVCQFGNVFYQYRHLHALALFDAFAHWLAVRNESRTNERFPV